MSNEFEKQKQEIKGMLIEGVSRIKNEFDNHLSFGTFDMEEIDTARHDLCDALDEFNKLKPPAPPTCNTCKYHIKPENNPVRRTNGCWRLIWQIPFEATIWGCSHHSDYDKNAEVKNEQ